MTDTTIKVFDGANCVEEGQYKYQDGELDKLVIYGDSAPDTMKVVSITRQDSFQQKIVVSSENRFGARGRTTFTCFPSTGGIIQLSNLQGSF
tara:strand:- start:187 stop:462 length:276 start_codon:yes stop_codon:yes gene_type:complete